MSKETEERLRLDTAATLSEERQPRLHAEAETRAALAVLAAEEGRGWTEVARVARLSEEMDRLSLVTGVVSSRRGTMQDGSGPRCIVTFHLLPSRCCTACCC